MTTTSDRPRLVDYRGYGEKAKPTFSASEMQRRQDAVRRHMSEARLDAALFTSYHNICYLTDFLYCQFGRKYGLVLTQDGATTITAAIDGGQPWRRCFADNITYTDWSKDNYFHAVRDLTRGVKRLGIEFDHVSLEFRGQLEAALPGVELVDIAGPAMRLRMVKSAQEIAHIPEMARVADVGGASAAETALR